MTLRCAFAGLLLAACNLSSSVDLDASGEDSAREADGAVGDVADGGASSWADPGPLTLIVDEIDVLHEERLCDLDGDGEWDNVVADLGPGASAAVAGVLETLLAGNLATGGQRMVLHFPWVESLREGRAAFTAFAGQDSDHPFDGADDFSGEEPFLAWYDSLGPCAAPLWLAEGVPLAEGAFSADIDELQLRDGVVLRGAHGDGRVTPSGAEGELELCGYMPAAVLGASTAGIQGSSPLTLLELVVAGGEAEGIPGIPGITPDVDVDGDGLERFELDDAHELARCIDGDRTEIEGRECYRDERIADGFSLNLALSAVSADFLGPVPPWRWSEHVPCDEDFADLSSWGRCPVAEPACERGELRECTAACGGAGLQQCLFDCSGYSGCRIAGASSFEASSCADIAFEGFPSGGEPEACSDAGGLSAALVDGPHEVRGLRLARDVVVGTGPLLVEARVLASQGGSPRPGHGWALVAYLGTEGGWLGSGPEGSGIDFERRGVALEWHFYSPDGSGEERDQVVPHVLPGGGERAYLCGEQACLQEGAPLLEGGDDVAGTVPQALRLIIEPDLPDSPENELVVTAQLPYEELDGDETRQLFFWFEQWCAGDDCEVQVQAGDVLQVGVTASTGAADGTLYGDSVVRVTGLAVETRGACPPE